MPGTTGNSRRTRFEQELDAMDTPAVEAPPHSALCGIAGHPYYRGPTCPYCAEIERERHTDEEMARCRVLSQRKVVKDPESVAPNTKRPAGTLAATCKRGHRFTLRNTRISWVGKYRRRVCRACVRRAQRMLRATKMIAFAAGEVPEVWRGRK